MESNDTILIIKETLTAAIYLAYVDFGLSFIKLFVGFSISLSCAYLHVFRVLHALEICIQVSKASDYLAMSSQVYISLYRFLCVHCLQTFESTLPPACYLSLLRTKCPIFLRSMVDIYYV